MESIKKDHSNKKIGVFIVAYNAELTIQSVLERIPDNIWEKITEVYIFDDASSDSTTRKSVAFKSAHSAKIRVFYNQVNLGYGGNQKRGYLYAIKEQFDVVVLLHGDGQYAPECIESLINPITDGDCHAVFGSRMMSKGGAMAGGMPLYKFMGNKVLTSFQNFILKSNLTEYHSGYRAYDVHTLANLPFMKNSNDFHFDTEIIIQLIEGKRKIIEVPIPTYYGSEICRVNGLGYAWNVFKTTMQYSFYKKELIYKEQFDFSSGEKYSFKKNRFSSHEQILKLLFAESFHKTQFSRVLDIGCGSGELAAKMGEVDIEVTGVDFYDNPKAKINCAKFIAVDIEKDLGNVIDGQYDRIVLADILEHIRNPEEILLEVRDALTERGCIIASTGNVAHIFIRMMLFLGVFNYTERGILDRTHVHLYTVKSFKDLINKSSFDIESIHYCPIPFENIIPGHRRFTDIFSWINMLFVKLLPKLFAYQVIVVAKPRRDRPSDLLRERQILTEYTAEKIDGI